MFLNNQQVTKEIKREIKKNSRNKWQWKYNNSKPMGCNKSNSKRDVYNNTIVPQETKKTPNKNLTFHPEQLEKEDEEPQQKLVEGKKSWGSEQK